MAYFEGDQDKSAYQGGRSKGQVDFAAIGDNDSPSELELDERGGRNTDIEVESYLVNHRVADDYRDAERAGYYDDFKTLAIF